MIEDRPKATWQKKRGPSSQSTTTARKVNVQDGYMYHEGKICETTAGALCHLYPSKLLPLECKLDVFLTEKVYGTRCVTPFRKS